MLKALHNEALGKLILRLAIGGLMLLHGIAKLMNPESLNGISQMLAAHGLPTVLAYGVLIGEVLAPLMAIIGWQARIAGLLMAGNMVVAISLAHTDELLLRSATGGWALELQGLFLFGAIAIMLLGSGRMAYRPD